MAGSIENGELGVFPTQACLFGENRDTAGALLIIVIQKTVTMINAPEFPDGTGKVEHGFGQGCFSGIHMCQQPYAS